MTAKQKQYNKQLSRKRTIVENVIGYLKEYRILAGMFAGTAEQYNNTFNVVAGLVNFKRMWPADPRRLTAHAAPANVRAARRCLFPPVNNQRLAVSAASLAYGQHAAVFFLRLLL